MQLTEHFRLAEFVASPTARRHGIDNTPPPLVVDALRALCEHVLEPLRVALGRPLAVTSGYRCVALNRRVGGAANSQHLIGEAADIHAEGLTARQLFDWIRTSDLPFDQVILENGWVHVSYAKTQQRRHVLVADFSGGRVRYSSVTLESMPPKPVPLLSKSPAAKPAAQSLSQPERQVSAPNDEFGTLDTHRTPFAAERAAGRVWPFDPLDAVLADQRLPGAPKGVFETIVDRLVGRGANATKWAAGIVALVGFWQQLVEAAHAVGITLPADKRAWFALAIALAKLVWSRAR